MTPYKARNAPWCVSSSSHGIGIHRAKHPYTEQQIFRLCRNNTEKLVKRYLPRPDRWQSKFYIDAFDRLYPQRFRNRRPAELCRLLLSWSPEKIHGREENQIRWPINATEMKKISLFLLCAWLLTGYTIEVNAQTSVNEKYFHYSIWTTPDWNKWKHSTRHRNRKKQPKHCSVTIGNARTSTIPTLTWKTSA